MVPRGIRERSRVGTYLHPADESISPDCSMYATSVARPGEVAEIAGSLGGDELADPHPVIQLVEEIAGRRREADAPDHRVHRGPVSAVRCGYAEKPRHIEG